MQTADTFVPASYFSGILCSSASPMNTSLPQHLFPAPAETFVLGLSLCSSTKENKLISEEWKAGLEDVMSALCTETSDKTVVWDGRGANNKNAQPQDIF